MRILNLFKVFYFIIILFFFSCTGDDGADGKDGDVYIALDWVSDITFIFSDPNIPQTIWKNQFYLTIPGSYSFSYISWDGSSWTGTYDLNTEEGEPGEPGEFMKDGEDGEDGEDWCVTIGLWSSGPSIYDWACSGNTARIISESSDYIIEQKKFKNSGIIDHKSNKGVLMDSKLLNNIRNIELENYYESDSNTTYGTFGKYSYTLRYKKTNSLEGN